jgi:hypothetical protein
MIRFGNNYYVLNAPYENFYLFLMSSRAGQGQVNEIAAGQVTGYQKCLTCRPLLNNEQKQERLRICRQNLTK